MITSQVLVRRKNLIQRISLKHLTSMDLVRLLTRRVSQEMISKMHLMILQVKRHQSLRMMIHLVGIMISQLRKLVLAIMILILISMLQVNLRKLQMISLEMTNKRLQRKRHLIHLLWMRPQLQ